MTVSFPLAKRRELAYDTNQVDAFLAIARQAYDNYNSTNPTMTSSDVRRASFDIAKRGYSAAEVDAGLERLEKTLSEFERENIIMRDGWESLAAHSRQLLNEIKLRLDVPAKQRFRRAKRGQGGYRIADVDAFIDEVLAGLETSSVLRASWVRQALFRPQARGYNENEVDVVLDSLVDALVLAGQE